MSGKVFSHKVLIKVLVTTNKELCIYIQSQMNNAKRCYYGLLLFVKTGYTNRIICFIFYSSIFGGGGAFHLRRDAVTKSLLQLGKFEDFS